MGFYVDVVNGDYLNAQRKADQILEKVPGAVETDGLAFNPNLICVIENPTFDAAGWCYNRREHMEFFMDRSGRPKRWIVVPDIAPLMPHLRAEDIEDLRKERT